VSQSSDLSASKPFFFGWWQVMVALLVQAVAAGTIAYSYSVVVVPLAGEFESSRMMLMLGMTAMTLVGGLLSPWLGASIDRFSLKRMMLISACSLGLGFFALSLINDIWQMPLIYGVFMSVSSVILGPLSASTLLARWFSKKRGLAMGIAAMGTSIGGFLFPPLLQFLIDSFDWRVAFQLLAAVILLVLVPLIALMATDWPAQRNLFPDGGDAAPEQNLGGAAARTYDSAGAIMRERNFWAIAVVMGILFSSYSMLLSNLAPFAIGSGASPEQAALLISIIAIMGLIGKLLFGTIADRVDLRFGLAGSSSLLVMALICYQSDDNFNFLIAGSVLAGLAAGGMLPAWGALMAQAFGVNSYGRVMGLMNPVIMVFAIASPPLAGAIYDRTGSYQLTFILFSAMLVVAVCTLPFIQLRR
jgi:MFS family permease